PVARLSTRTFGFGGPRREIVEPEVKTRKDGTVKYERINAVVNDRGERIALTDGTGEVNVLGPTRRPVETFGIPHGSLLLAADGAAVTVGQVLGRWGPPARPRVSARGGKVRLVDVVEGKTLRIDHEASGGGERWTITEHQGERTPQVCLANERGQVVEVHYLAEGAVVEVREGQQVSPGTL